MQCTVDCQAAAPAALLVKHPAALAFSEMRPAACATARHMLRLSGRSLPSARQVGISFEDVRMAVLCQRIVPAQVSPLPPAALHW